jgi:S-adenosylmethionine-diacylglycerol 3-amino-3-carboxypropyl transferase
MPTIRQRAKFDFIRYASCWEDCDILLEALRIKPGDSCLSIGSSGDNSLALLTKDPELVVAVDFNPTQHACIDLRVEAFKNLTYPELLEFMGIDESCDRLRMYNEIKQGLKPYSMSFWDENIDLVEKGIIHGGKFERFFHIFRKYVVPFFHRQKTVRDFLSRKNPEQQKEYYSKVWNNLNWKILFKVFFSEFIVGRMGRDPEFFKHVDEDSVSASFKKRVDFHLSEAPIYDSPYINYIFTGNFPRHALPVYLRQENYNIIRNNLSRFKQHIGDIRSCIDQYSHVKFNAFNLSDIFEYMSDAEHRTEIEHMLQGSAPGARYAFWNLLVDRFFPHGLPIGYEKVFSEELFKRDRAPFYKRFVVGTYHGEK